MLTLGMCEFCYVHFRTKAIKPSQSFVVNGVHLLSWHRYPNLSDLPQCFCIIIVCYKLLFFFSGLGLLHLQAKPRPWSGLLYASQVLVPHTNYSAGPRIHAASSGQGPGFALSRNAFRYFDGLIDLKNPCGQNGQYHKYNSVVITPSVGVFGWQRCDSRNPVATIVSSEAPLAPGNACLFPSERRQ